MWPFCVVEVSPLFDQHLGLLEGVEDLPVQTLVPELAVEALVVAVLPGAAGRDEQSLDLQPSEPIAHDLSNKLGTVVGADVLWWAMTQEQLGEDIEHLLAVELTPDMNGETLPAVLVDHSQHAEGFPIMGPVLDEVIGPDVVLMDWPQPNAGPIVEPEPAPLGLLLGNLQPFASPDPLHPVETNIPALAT